MDERCETCRYLYSGFVDMCRRHPPQVVLIEGANGRVGPTSVFPRIEWPKAEWCGEYQPEDKKT